MAVSFINQKMNIIYSHQNFADADIRSAARIDKMADLPKDVYNSLIIQITNQINILNQSVANGETSQILNQISILHEMINKGAVLPDDLFSTDIFISNISNLILGASFCIPAYKLASRIMYFTDSIGTKLSELLFPSIEIFIQNAALPESEVIMAFLCNLSSDLQIHVKNPRASNQKHPLEHVANNFIPIYNVITQRPITECTLLFIRHVSNFLFQSNSNIFNLVINYLKNLTTTEHLLTNEYFMNIVLWTLFDICEKRHEQAVEVLVQDNFIGYLVDLIQKSNNRFAEPILSIFFAIVSSCDQIENPGTLNPKFDFNLPYIYQLCLTTTDAVQYEALQFLHQMTKVYPIFMYQNRVKELIFNLIEINCSYKAKIQVFWIACLILTCRAVMSLDAQSLHELLAFVVAHAESSDDEMRELLAVSSIKCLKISSQIIGKEEEFEELVLTAGGSEFIELMRESQNEAIIRAIDEYDNLSLIGYNDALQKIVQFDESYQDYYEEFDPDADPLEHKTQKCVSIKFVNGNIK